MTPARLLDLFAAIGGDAFVRSDGRLVLRASQEVIDALRPQIAHIGREALVEELRCRETAARARVAALLSSATEAA